MARASAESKADSASSTVTQLEARVQSLIDSQQQLRLKLDASVAKEKVITLLSRRTKGKNILLTHTFTLRT